MAQVIERAGARATVHVRGAAGAVATMLALGMVGVAAAGCGGSETGGSAAANGTLVIALPSQPENLNPIASDSMYGGNQKFFNGLLRYRKDLTAEPDLASAMPARSADGRTVTVKVRDDVTFPDGTALTAKDVAFTVLDPLDSATALDDTTVEFQAQPR